MTKKAASTIVITLLALVTIAVVMSRIAPVSHLISHSSKELASSARKTKDAAGDVRKSLGDAGYDDLAVDYHNGSVTLRGTVPSSGDKANVGSIAKKSAGAVSVSNEVAIWGTNFSTPVMAVTQAEEVNTNYDVVRIFYATDRKPTNSQLPSEAYGAERSDDESLSLGTLDVSIPKTHEIGMMERPSILRFEFREDPQKHVILLKVAPKPDAQFFSELKARIADSAGKEVFVFIHGYNVNFAEAGRRAAQIAYDLRVEGAPVLYSWPSRGGPLAYPADEATVEWTAPHLRQFLEKIAAETHVTTVNIVAHSMGNRALTSALSAIAGEHPQNSPIFNEVFLAAPDIDAGVFKQLARTFPTPAEHVTLYASSNDEALVASEKIHHGRRAGDSGGGIVVVPHVDTIDATAVDTGLGHSYYADSRSILNDMFSVMRRYDPPDRRFGMRPNRAEHPTYWILRP